MAAGATFRGEQRFPALGIPASALGGRRCTARQRDGQSRAEQASEDAAGPCHFVALAV
jgi:hypothetical protein